MSSSASSSPVDPHPPAPASPAARPGRDRLAEILDAKRREIAAAQPHREAWRYAALRRNDHRSFARALDREGDAASLRLIAEVKKASPSAGLIAPQFDAVAIARRYQAAGADALSVLTDKPFFQGDLADLRAVRAAVDLPVLRKDFILDELQIFEAAAHGADAILLIVAALGSDPSRLRALLDVAHACQLDVLVEVHSYAEMDVALEAEATIVGINNRDLTTFQVDLETTARLAEEAPAHVLLVSESGLRTAADCTRVRDSGADAVLVGETLMRCPPGDLAAKVAELKLGSRGAA